MYRVVFCPSEAEMPEAEKLAERYQLPILVGRNERLAGAEMDDSVVSVVNVPTDENAQYERSIKEPGFAFSVHYTNDFRMIDSSRMVVSSPSGETQEGNAQVREKHFASFVCRPNEPGDHTFTIMDGDETLFAGEFTVGKEKD